MHLAKPIKQCRGKLAKYEEAIISALATKGTNRSMLSEVTQGPGSQG